MKLRTRMVTNETRESFPLSVNHKKNEENLSQKMKNSRSSNSNRSNFLFAGKMLMNCDNNTRTEVVIRTRGKNNSIETKKGFVEVTVEENMVKFMVFSLFFHWPVFPRFFYWFFSEFFHWFFCGFFYWVFSEFFYWFFNVCVFFTGFSLIFL